MFVDPNYESDWWNGQGSEYEPVNGTGDIPPYVEEVCNTYSYVWQPVSHELKDLYRVVGSHEDDIQLAGSVKSTIDQFMNDGTDELS